MLYSSIALYLAFLSYRYDFGRTSTPDYRVVHRWLALLILVMLSGLRYRLAPDTVAYMAQFQTDVVPLGDLSVDYLVNAKYQPLWVLLTSVCKTFGSFTLLQFTVAWIFNGCVFYFLRRATTRFFTATLLFYSTCYFYFNMEILRESLAVAMFLIAVVRYNDRRFLAFFSWLIAAVLFHKFALILLVTPFLLTRRIPGAVKFLLPVAVIVGLNSVGNPFEYVDSFGGFISSLNLQSYEVERELSTLGLIYNLLRIAPIILVLIWYQSRPLADLRLRKEVIFPLCWAYVFVVIIRIISIPFMDRVSNYFVFFVLCCLVSALSDLLENGQLKAFRIPLMSGAIILSFFFYILPLLQPDPKLGDISTIHRYYPYSSVFTMQTDPDREQIIYLEAKE